MNQTQRNLTYTNHYINQNLIESKDDQLSPILSIDIQLDEENSKKFEINSIDELSTKLDEFCTKNNIPENTKKYINDSILEKIDQKELNCKYIIFIYFSRKFISYKYINDIKAYHDRVQSSQISYDEYKLKNKDLNKKQNIKLKEGQNKNINNNIYNKNNEEINNPGLRLYKQNIEHESKKVQKLKEKLLEEQKKEDLKLTFKPQINEYSRKLVEKKEIKARKILLIKIVIIILINHTRLEKIMKLK